MTAVLLTSILVSALMASILRVEHLVASDIWILIKGKAFSRRQDNLLKRPNGRNRLADPAERWKLYEEFDGGRLPWLFFGIQSSRLMGWSAGATGVRRILLKVFRGLWRYYTYGTLSVVLTIACVWFCQFRSALDSGVLLANMVTLTIGSVVVAAGGVLASMRMGALAKYHHFGWPPVGKSNIAPHELAFVFGSAIIAFVVTSGLALVIGVEYDGYGWIESATSKWEQLWKSCFIALTGILGQGFSDSQNGFGALGLAMVSIVQASHTVILLAATQKTWSK